jgi:hypothetical protein
MSDSWLHPYYPNYYFSDFKFDSPYIGAAKVVPDGDKTVYTINVGQSEPKTVTLYSAGKLAGLATVEFSAMDAWFEEDEEIFSHPKDPYKVCYDYQVVGNHKKKKKKLKTSG